MSEGLFFSSYPIPMLNRTFPRLPYKTRVGGRTAEDSPRFPTTALSKMESNFGKPPSLFSFDETFLGEKERRKGGREARLAANGIANFSAFLRGGKKEGRRR